MFWVPCNVRSIKDSTWPEHKPDGVSGRCDFYNDPQILDQFPLNSQKRRLSFAKGFDPILHHFMGNVYSSFDYYLYIRITKLGSAKMGPDTEFIYYLIYDEPSFKPHGSDLKVHKLQRLRLLIRLTAFYVGHSIQIQNVSSTLFWKNSVLCKNPIILKNHWFRTDSVWLACVKCKDIINKCWVIWTIHHNSFS